MLIIILYTLNEIRHLICSNNSSCFLNLNLTYKTLWTRVGGCFFITILKKINFFCFVISICPMKFLSPHVALHLYKSTIWPCIYIFFFMSGQVHRIVGPSLAASLEPLVHHLNAASLCIFFRYYFSRYSSDLAEMVPLPYSKRLHVKLLSFNL